MYSYAQRSRYDLPDFSYLRQGLCWDLKPFFCNQKKNNNHSTKLRNVLLISDVPTTRKRSLEDKKKVSMFSLMQR